MGEMRVALYGRYSSDLQNPTSAADQIAKLRRELARLKPDWTVVEEAKDEGLSGTSLKGRDGLKRLGERAAARPRPFDVGTRPVMACSPVGDLVGASRPGGVHGENA